MSLYTLLSLAHFVGLALGVGAATVKLILLIRCYTDTTLVPSYLRIAKLVTGQIIAGMILLTLSGIGWLLAGYSFTPLLIVKVTLVAAIWVLGPIIDNVVEPRFRRLSPTGGAPASPAFLRAQKQHLALEIVATLLFYVTIAIWVLR